MILQPCSRAIKITATTTQSPPARTGQHRDMETTMEAAKWLGSLGSAFCEPPAELRGFLLYEGILATEDQNFLSSGRIVKRLCCPQCRSVAWQLQVILEEEMKRTHRKVDGGCLRCNNTLNVFDANEFGWAYPSVASQQSVCACGSSAFAMFLALEPYEDALTDTDISWVWVITKCTKCHDWQIIADWELD